MQIPPTLVNVARIGWKWQWTQLMNGLAPADQLGQYLRPISQHPNEFAPSIDQLKNRSPEQFPILIIGRSCPWAHRTWLVYELLNLKDSIRLLIAKADHNSGLWRLDPPWMKCNSLLQLYKFCGTNPSLRATVPVLIDPLKGKDGRPQIICNESAELVKILNKWSGNQSEQSLYPENLQKEINQWQDLIQANINDGVYRCGFARNQAAYNKASDLLFQALEKVNKALSIKGPWLCGKQLTLADIRLFPTLIRWEMVYAPLFGCTQEPLWKYPHIWEWRQRMLKLPEITRTCDAAAWREDYFGALFPLNPSNIVPSGPDLAKIVNTTAPQLQ